MTDFVNTNTGRYMFIAWIIINSLLFAPYACYQTYRFYKHKTIPFIFNRKPDMTMSFCICCLLTLIFVMPFCYGFEIFTEKQISTEHYGYITISYFIAATFIIGFWRAWHVWFDAQYKMEAATNTWAKHLDNSESNMYKKYKNTIGNPSFTKKYLIFTAILLTCAFIGVILMKAFIWIEGIICFAVFLSFIGLFIVIKRLSAVKDEILLRTEYIYFASLGVLYACVLVTLYSVSHDWNKPDPSEIDAFYDALYLIIPSPILYSLLLVQTQWVLYQYYKQRRVQKKKTMDDTIENNEQFGPNGRLIVSLEDIMADFEGYKAFMEYLVKCVSAENLLFVSEALQFMKDLTKRYNVRASSVYLQTYFDQYKIPKILPNSAIMTQIEATSVRFLRLCEKYINVGSEFEINISHKHRKNLIKIYKLLEEKIDSLNPKINKLQSLFGINESELTASRRASKSKYLPENKEQMDIFDNYKRTNSQLSMKKMTLGDDEDDLPNGSTEIQNDVSQSNKIAHIHSCVEDFQLLSNTDDVIQTMYDSLCYSLGDVHTNLNDGCSRFMQTDVYYRWFDNSFKKEQVLSDEEEPSYSSEEDRKKAAIPSNGFNVMQTVPSNTNNEQVLAGSDEDVSAESPNTFDGETKPINGSAFRFSTAL